MCLRACVSERGCLLFWIDIYFAGQLLVITQLFCFGTPSLFLFFNLLGQCYNKNQWCLKNNNKAFRIKGGGGLSSEKCVKTVVQVYLVQCRGEIHYCITSEELCQHFAVWHAECAVLLKYVMCIDRLPLDFEVGIVQFLMKVLAQHYPQCGKHKTFQCATFANDFKMGISNVEFECWWQSKSLECTVKVKIRIPAVSSVICNSFFL